ncbi:MAG TPA: glycoside hydrolase family 2 TIM barrel-domain containing protein [Azospirillaceae bacterium]|nr:glycoside hydrolase family 2 TIM barrel-domain containing protein [Azospirillaceae bacterium]
MIACRVTLDGTWEFQHAAGPSAAPGRVRSIQVPGPWQAQFDDLRMKSGVGIYRRDVVLPEGWVHGQVWLRFGAAFHNATVWVNGVPVGENEGGWLPFAFDVTRVLVDGRNEITVRVESPVDCEQTHADGSLAEMPFGKQSWYGPQSGIWQSVTLERRDPDHVARVRVSPDLATGRVATTIALARPVSGRMEVEIAVRDPMGRVVADRIETPCEGAESVELPVHLAEVHAWSPDTPNLYTLAVSLRRDGRLVDRVEERFGFRTFETRDGRFYLNGKPFYMRAALDQDYYPDGLCTTPSVEFLEDQLRKAKHLGLNTLRCHIKVADPRYYEVADRLGMLIWTELPNGGRLTKRARGRAEALLKAIVDRDGNHPSIVIWTIINENWGTDLVHNAEHRAWLKRTYAWLKSYDPTRLVVDNSPLAPSMHVRTDIADMHFYAAVPDHRDQWDRFVDELASRPAWLFSQEGDAETTGQEPLMCSEFGNWGLPHPEDLADAEGREPWWFETGHDWGEGVMYAHGVQNRFHDWSLDRVFGSLRGFVEAAQWQQFRAFKYEIEAMRRKPTLAGYVITELTDCHWESNGLLDMRRNPRVFHNVFGTVNADTVIVPRWERLSYWSGETARIELAVAHGAGEPLEGATLEAFLGEGRLVPVPRLEPGSVADLGTLEFAVPRATEPGIHRLVLELRDGGGRIVATNHLDLAVHPARRASIDVPVWSPDPSIRVRLDALGYRLADDLDSAALVVATAADAAIVERVRAGGRLLLLPEADVSLTPFFPHWQAVKVVNREGTMWAGDWASSFAWLRRGNVFRDMPGGPLLDEAFDRVIPTHVISGCNLMDFQSRVHAGLVVGWIHKAVGLAVERGYGEGRLVVSTFRLFRDAPGADPTATALLDRLATLALGTADPRLERVTQVEPV